jgi:thiosulfate/3-mercaptopyruvate sulfurtransferase
MTLISAAELAARLDDSRVRVADVRWFLGEPERGRAAYEEGHIPRAVYVDLDRDLAAPSGPGRHPLPEPAVFAKRMGELGLGSDDLVVAYDDMFGTIAARLWWMLDNLGHRQVAVLDGGLKAWREAGLPIETGPGTPAIPREMRLRAEWSGTVDRDALAGRLDDVALLDARVAERYRGDVEPVDAQAGHIPSAVNAPARIALSADGRFLPPDELASKLEQVAPGGRPVVASCGSGVTACHTILAFRVAGRDDPILYPGSFSDWSRSDRPVATGDEPGRLNPE